MTQTSFEAKLLALEALAQGGAGGLALRRLEALALNSDIAPEDLTKAGAAIREIMRRVAQRIDCPADHWILAAEGASGGSLPPMRRLPQPKVMLPRPYPMGLVLPRAHSLASAALCPLVEAERHLPNGIPQGLGRVRIILASDNTSSDIKRLTAMLARQSLQLPLKISVFAHGAVERRGGALEVLPFSICAPEAVAEFTRITEESDQLLFVEGGTDLDRTALERLCRLAATSARVIQPLIPPKDNVFRPFALERLGLHFPVRLPFRGLRGMNLMISARLWAELGGLCTRFSSRNVAALELGYRAYIAGAWFVPQEVRTIGQMPLSLTGPQDITLYRALCPNRVDRPSGAGFEVPKVAIYIPAHNASRFIAEAVRSALDQDYKDLEVCIHDDGSTDDTLRLLQNEFSGEARVRWQTAPNQGIGHASNAAIAMSRSLYIGQLDADDRLLPGAVSRLVEKLEADPGLACVYAACERIDATGQVMRPEYEWPVFSREKLMMTSIVHHFRMFRRQAFARTDGFRTDIRNAVDYDLFLKLAEVGRLEHLREVLYQRRWHDSNTSLNHEGEQSRNTHVVQRAALTRMALSQSWALTVPDPAAPRQVTYQRLPRRPVVFFWPDYSAENPYQKLLYQPFRTLGADVMAASPEAALKAIQLGTVDPKTLTFHLHWLHYLFPAQTDFEGAKQAARQLLGILSTMKAAGVRVVWTVHNLVSHESRYPELELALSRRIADLADLVHLHDQAGADIVMRHFPVPLHKLCIARHGHYSDTYPAYVPRAAAREILGLTPEDEVILFCGAVRPYKGVEELIVAFRQLAQARPAAKLVVAGAGAHDPFAALSPALDPAKSQRILRQQGFVEAGELQVFFHAADVVALPYRQVLTSGSALLALGFGCPIVLPAATPPARVLHDRPFVSTYDAGQGPAALAWALDQRLCQSAAQRRSAAAEAMAYARSQTWPEPTEFALLQPGDL